MAEAALLSRWLSRSGPEPPTLKHRPNPRGEGDVLGFSPASFSIQSQIDISLLAETSRTRDACGERSTAGLRAQYLEILSMQRSCDPGTRQPIAVPRNTQIESVGKRSRQRPLLLRFAHDSSRDTSAIALVFRRTESVERLRRSSGLIERISSHPFPQ